MIYLACKNRRQHDVLPSYLCFEEDVCESSTKQGNAGKWGADNAGRGIG